jgi:hypothetical protein
MPGLVVASNITPDVETGIGSWSDGEKIRAIAKAWIRMAMHCFP